MQVVTGSQIVSRARSAIGMGCAYGLGKGGFDPDAPMPFGRAKLCDCSGFVAWVFGVSRDLRGNPRYPKGVGWFETSNLVKDAQSPWGDFDLVKWSDAKPGMIVVYGDSPPPARRQGHVGVVATVGPNGPRTFVHCSTGNERKFGDSIYETQSAFMLERGAIAARCSWVTA
jgi:cell wall-associated NlpC family hydrolase